MAQVNTGVFDRDSKSKDIIKYYLPLELISSDLFSGEQFSKKLETMAASWKTHTSSWKLINDEYTMKGDPPRGRSPVSLYSQFYSKIIAISKLYSSIPFSQESQHHIDYFQTTFLSKKENAFTLSPQITFVKLCIWYSLWKSLEIKEVVHVFKMTSHIGFYPDFRQVISSKAHDEQLEHIKMESLPSSS